MTLRIGAAVMVVLVGGALATAETVKVTEPKVVAPDELTWGRPPPGLPPSIEAAVVDGDPTQPGNFVVRLRLRDGTQIRPHWHPTDENVTVLSGHFAIAMGDVWSARQLKELGPGGFVHLPASHRHFGQARGETVVQINSTGPFEIHYVHPSDDPRNQRSSR
jgi:quercetin dioxygenase-like cupin family protein